MLGESLEGCWFNRTKEWAARRRSEDFQKYDYATRYRLELAPLPCFRHLTPEEYRERVARLVREIEQEAAAKRGDRPVVGMAEIRRQNPHTRPDKTSHSPAPRCHVKTREKLEQFLAEYGEFIQRYRAAADRLRFSSLHRNLDFPERCFPPALPFVGAAALPAPPPPPTRAIRIAESGEIVRGEIPLVVVPRDRPPTTRAPPLASA